MCTLPMYLMGDNVDDYQHYMSNHQGDNDFRDDERDDDDDDDDEQYLPKVWADDGDDEDEGGCGEEGDDPSCQHCKMASVKLSE